jgi:hypothetical protein
MVGLSNESNKLIILSKKYFFDFSIYIFLLFYIIKYKFITITIAQDINSLPSNGWPRREHLIGHRFLSEPFFMGGAYSGSFNDFNLGPTPFNYPVALGWFISKYAFGGQISPFYITTNIFYFITISILIAIFFLVKNSYGKIGTYIYLLIMISSFYINSGNEYLNKIPTHMNPGSVQIYSILLIFLFLASITKYKDKYIYFLVFISGILMQNYIASSLYSLIFLFYGIFFYIKYINKFNKFFIFLSLIPWIQIIIRFTIDYNEFLNTINFIKFRNSWEGNNNYSIPLTTLINQMPLNNLLNNYKDNISNSFSILFFIFFLILPLLNLFMINKVILIDYKYKKLIKLITLLFVFDYILTIIFANETQQFNHLAGHSYLFLFLLFFSIFSKIKYIYSSILLSLLIGFVILNNNSISNSYYHDNSLFTKVTKSKLLEEPIKIERFDYYNGMDAVYTDIVYELLSYNVDLCIAKPDINKLYKIYHKNMVNSMIRSNKFIEHLFCNNKQLSEDRRSLYLLEDPNISLPVKPTNATLIGSIPSFINLRCNPEYYRKLDIGYKTNNICIYYINGEPYNNISVYLEDSTNENDILSIQNNLVESAIINGKSVWGSG